MFEPGRALRRAVLPLCVATLVALTAAPVALRADPGDGGGGGGGDLPNVLVIVTDDQRASGTLGVMPSTLHWFDEGGTRFPRAYATTPQCCPSRATLFSGRYAHNHGVLNNTEAPNLNHAETVQAYLQGAGYRTGIFGKFFNSWKLAENPPVFDDWAIFREGYYQSEFNVNGKTRLIDQYSTDFVARRALRFLRQSEESDAQPWLMFVTPFAPHDPARAETTYRTSWVGEWSGNPSVQEADRSDKPPYIQDSQTSFDTQQRKRKKQLRTLISVDDLVDSVMSELQRLNEEERTLAFFLSDNGLMWGEHGASGKGLPYTPSIEIPFYARWPGTFPAGGVDQRMATTVDVVPTILQAAGVATTPEQVDGRSLLESWDRDRVLTESWTPAWASVRTRSYQYTEWYDADGITTFREYYDLEDDPWQLTNLLGDADPGNDPPATLVASLSAQLAADRLCAGSEGLLACP